VLAGLAAGATIPLLEVAYHYLRDPLSEDYVWGCSFLPLSLPASTIIFGPIFALVLVGIRSFLNTQRKDDMNSESQSKETEN